MSDEQAEIITGMVFPSAGVRILIPLMVTAFMEEASGEPMATFSDYNIGVSVGAVPATAFALDAEDKPGTPRFTAADVLHTTFATAHVMFAGGDAVIVNNIRRDAAKLVEKHMPGRVGSHVAGALRRWEPSRHLSRYDHAILAKSLGQRYGDTRLSESTKTVLLIAHELRQKQPNIFAHIDPAMFPHDDIESLNIGYLPLHRNNRIVQALLATTAIPGLIGYHCVDSLSATFMDSGTFAAPGIGMLMDDLHDATVNRMEAEHQRRTSARGAWIKSAWNKPRQKDVASRILVMGVGNEAGMGFDETGELGVVAQANDIARAAGEHVVGFTIASINRRFKRLSMTHTDRPAIQMIDLPITAQSDEEKAVFPSSSISDGRLGNLLKLVDFGKRVIHAHRDTLFDEIMLRMRTLEQRGQRTEEQVRAVEERLAKLNTPEAIDALCAHFEITYQNVHHILNEHGIEVPKEYMPVTIPAANDDGARPKPQSWLQTARAAAFSF